MHRASRDDIVRFFDSLRGTLLDGRMVLGGSSGLYGFTTKVEPFTEDVDLIIDEALVRENEEELIGALETAGFRHVAGTATFTDDEGHSFDFIGYSTVGESERVGGGELLKVMVFADLSRLMGQPYVTERTQEGVITLSAPAFAVLKLMTVRDTKSAKDKLQALAVIAENGNDLGFRSQFAAMFSAFDPEQRDDAVGDAYAAILTLSEDPLYRGGEIAEYGEYLKQVTKGYELLRSWTGDQNGP